MHIAHINVRSLNKKMELIKATFQESNATIITMSETWLNELFDQSYNMIEGYVTVRQDREWGNRKKGGGICSYIKTGINFSEHKYKRFNTNCVNLESQWISIKQNVGREIIIVNCYRPPQGTVKECLELLNKGLNEIDLNKCDIFIIGDMNMNVLDKGNKDIQCFVNSLKQKGLLQYIKEHTRISSTTSTCIDLCFSNTNMLAKAIVCDVAISDHELILVTRKKGPTVKVKCAFYGRSYRNFDKTQFKNKLSEYNWDNLQDINNVDRKWAYLHKTISDILDEMCPIKKFKINKIKQPWITPQLLELIKDKDFKLAKAKRSKLPADWMEARKIRNFCTKRLRNAKAEFIRDKMIATGGDQKKFWKNIQDIIPNTKKSQNLISLINENTGEVIPENQTANFINDFFLNIGPKLAAPLDREWDYIGVETEQIIDDITVTSEQIEKLCEQINTNKSSGLPNIATWLLKDAFLCLPDIVTMIINASFDSCICPDVWKIANVVPLQKEGNKQLVSNLRPVSLLPVQSKIIEKVVHKKIYEHLQRNDLLCKEQGGFREGFSTVSTASFFVNEIYKSINQKKYILATYLDIKKAFDTVNHQILLKKCKKLGIQGKLLNWLKNYLINRKQITIANNVTSDMGSITCGVPQGSILGPLLFLIYINDLNSCLTCTSDFLYADDTVLLCSGNDLNNVCDNMQNDLDNISNWCNSNKLTINSKKTKFMIFGNRNMLKKIKNTKFNLNMDGQALDRVHCYKYLGLNIDDNLNFNKHIQDMNKIITHKLYMFSKIRFYIGEKDAIILFKSMILPIVEYCDIVYEGTSKRNLDKIDKLYKQGLRICVRNRNPTVRNFEELQQICQLCTLEIRRKVHLRNFMYKQQDNIDLIKRRNIRTRLHAAIVFKFYKPNSEKSRQNVIYRGAIEWNKLGKEQRLLANYKSFKSSQKKFMSNILMR